MSPSPSSEARAAAPATLTRHRLGVRVLHGLNALVVIILLISGLAIGDLLTDGFVAALGGHTRLNSTHQWLGLAFAATGVLLIVVQPRKSWGLLRDALYFRRAEWRWPVAFTRFHFRPRRHAAPFHDGRFDPAQRLVFIGIIAGLLLAAASGVYLYFLPPLGRTALMWAIRIHIAADWLLIGCVIIHILAGIGLPRTHRGLAGAMFGNGRVTIPLARALWPGWTQRQTQDRDSDH